ncbi:MAG TPA: response regulator [Polyangiaceae bacterium]
MTDRVLIIDDSLTVRMDLKQAFESSGLLPVLCSTAKEARARLSEDSLSLVVLDVLLPDEDGIELLKDLRSAPGTEALPVILLSSEAEVSDRVRGLRTGANEYVGKPYDAAYIVSRARELLRRRRPRGDRPTILIIDDSATFREELAEQLSLAGYGTEKAVDGEQGLHLAAELQPDAIIVDGVMPGMDGPTVVRRIRLDPGLQSTPCLLLTASEGATSEILALDAGADAYVRKTEDLPVILARLTAMLRSAKESRERAPAASALGSKKVLAVDDSPTYLAELTEHLSAQGYEVIKARSGKEALELLSVQMVDCILLDLMMPGLSGTDTCRRIKGSPLLRNVPLIMLTALDEREAMITAINVGADDYITKSSDFEVLRARLRAQVRRKQFEDENRRVREELLQRDAETRSAQELAETRATLLDALAQKNSALELLNQELQTFAYSVSHDLRAPLRSMDGFSSALLERYGDELDSEGRHYLERIRAGAKRMGDLIDGLLTLSRVTRKELNRKPVHLEQIAKRVLAQFRDLEPDRSVETYIQEDMVVHADPQLIESAIENLLGNAWKFTSQRPQAKIEFTAAANGQAEMVYTVRDNGAGFDIVYSDKLFGPFQRLHSPGEYEGTGIGLATVQRIIRRHGGRIWAEAAPNQGASFHFVLEGLHSKTRKT